MYIDTHCHLTAPAFGSDLDGVLARCRESRVDRVITVASSLEDAGRVGGLIRDVPWLRGTAGVHPHEVGAARSDDLVRIEELLRTVPGMVAVGETGLDFHYDHSPRGVQRRFFEAHLELAVRLGLPAVVHSRSADRETAAILRDVGSSASGVLHCFDGDHHLLETALEIGWYVSFTGMITFANYQKQELVRAVPRDRIMIETDAPYMAPVPHRGSRNEPARVVDVGAGLAAILGEEPESVARFTTGNAVRFFDLGDE